MPAKLLLLPGQGTPGGRPWLGSPSCSAGPDCHLPRWLPCCWEPGAPFGPKPVVPLPDPSSSGWAAPFLVSSGPSECRGQQTLRLPQEAALLCTSCPDGSSRPQEGKRKFRGAVGAGSAVRLGTGSDVASRSFYYLFFLLVMKVLKSAAIENLSPGGGGLHWLEHLPDTPRLRVRSPVRAHIRVNQPVREWKNPCFSLSFPFSLKSVNKI